MNALDLDDLDSDTKISLFHAVADQIGEEINATPSHVVPGDAVLYVNEWWGEVLTDAFDSMSRIDSDMPNTVDASIPGIHILGVPVKHDEPRHTPTIVREERE